MALGVLCVAAITAITAITGGGRVRATARRRRFGSAAGRVRWSWIYRSLRKAIAITTELKIEELG